MVESITATERLSGSHQLRLRIRSEAPWVVVGSLITLFATVIVFQLWNLNPRIPVLYSGDGLLTLNGLRNMKLGNWYWTTDKLGVPFGQDLRDFPAIADNLHLVMLWVGIKVFRDEFLVFNGFFFATYLFAFLGGFIGSRMLRISQPISVFIGVIYAILPYHFQHGPGHLYLAAYWPIPIWFSFLARQLIQGMQIPGPNNLSIGQIRSWLTSAAGIQVIVISVIAATTGLYYAFFFLALSFVTGLINISERDSKKTWFPTFWSALISMLILGLQFFPIWLYQKQNGNNLSIVKRSISALEFYSLKLSNMVLPVSGHRLHFLASLRDRSNPAYLVGEGTEALGVLGTVGLLAIVCMSIFALRNRISELFRVLTTLAVSSLIIAMTGGLGFLLGVAGFTQIRVWSRMSIVIAFPAIIICAIFIEKILRRLRPPLFFTCLSIILCLVILDTNPGHQLPSYAETSREWNSDKSLVSSIENKFGRDAQVFQFPQVPFPENPPVVRMSDYDLLRGYMHSTTMKWSYGGVKGRVLIDDEVSQGFLKKLSQSDFEVIWLDKYGYEDYGLQITKELVAAGFNKVFETERIDIFEITRP